MEAFVVNRHGRLVFPANFLGELDFSVLETLDQFTAVIGRDFEAKAPTGTDILARVETDAYPGHFELLRDLGQNLFWANRFTIPMFDRRPTRWRDLGETSRRRLPAGADPVGGQRAEGGRGRARVPGAARDLGR